MHSTLIVSMRKPGSPQHSPQPPSASPWLLQCAAAAGHAAQDPEPLLLPPQLLVQPVLQVPILVPPLLMALLLVMAPHVWQQWLAG